MTMAPKRSLTSTDVGCSGLKISPLKTLKQIENATAYRAHDTDLKIDLLGFSCNTCHIVRIEPPLELRLFLDLTKERGVQRFETT